MTGYFFNASYFLLFIIADGEKWLTSIIADFIDVQTWLGTTAKRYNWNVEKDLNTLSRERQKYIKLNKIIANSIFMIIKSIN